MMGPAGSRPGIRLAAFGYGHGGTYGGRLIQDEKRRSGRETSPLWPRCNPMSANEIGQAIFDAKRPTPPNEPHILAIGAGLGKPRVCKGIFCSGPRTVDRETYLTTGKDRSQRPRSLSITILIPWMWFSLSPLCQESLL